MIFPLKMMIFDSFGASSLPNLQVLEIGWSFLLSLPFWPSNFGTIQTQAMWHVDAEAACRHVSALGRMRHMYIVVQANTSEHAYKYDWLVAWNILAFPYIGKNHPNWTDFHIFQRGSNHQPK